MVAKEEMLRAIGELPDDAQIEDAMDRLYFLAKVERGIEQADLGETISQQDLEQRVSK
ncbi:MAG: hypothetical protein JO314_13955 [Acidobacteria bacterium]|nr:hypothetical protein [Acidobacteriota bacterium]